MMRTIVIGGMIGLAALGAWAGAEPNQASRAAGPKGDVASPVLQRFASARAFADYLKTLEPSGGDDSYGDIVVTGANADAPAASAPAVAAAPPPANPEITNNQTAGVDEGGIVKQIGRFLVVLQDGRLFSADLGDGTRAHPRLRLADRTDVYRNSDVAASWYDEMLVFGDRVLVTAYNYREHASEITALRVDPATGKIRREGRFLISSNDYYSTDNYATRLVGDTLVFYAPFALHGGDAAFAWPRLRRADGDGPADRGQALFGPTEIYAPPGKVAYPTLHTVSMCPLKPRLECRTVAFVGPAMREFYVSPTDAFVWIGTPDGLPWSIDYANRRRACPGGESWRDAGGDPALLYRVPLDGGPIGAVGVDGVPTDQFAFDSKDGRFRALLTRPDGGCARYDAPSALALMDIPLDAFDATLRHVPARRYARLPPIAGGGLENRFVGDWLVYGGRATPSSALTVPLSRRAPAVQSAIYTVPLARPAAWTRVMLPHDVVRIERAGTDAVVTGYDARRTWSISYAALGAQPRLMSTATVPYRYESEGRSHAFNAWIRADGSGLIGIPTSRRSARSARLWSDSRASDLSYIAISPDKRLAPAGELEQGRGEPVFGYHCKVSCIDWYGNSRPVFTAGRIFALMGTELVEGRVQHGRIAEVDRVDLTARVR